VRAGERAADLVVFCFGSDAIEDNALDDAADAYAMLTMPAEARLNLTPDPQIPGRVGYVRIG